MSDRWAWIQRLEAWIQRLDWIDEMLRIYGFINRNHIMRKFWVSKPQASKDLKDFLSSNRGRDVIYNATAKRYERVKKVKP